MTHPNAAFCVQCGAPLPAGARFCARCGHEAQSVSTISTTSPVAADAEPILAILSGLQRRSGFLGLKAQTFNLIITPRRLILAAVSPKLMKEAVAQARDQAKGQGAGFLGQWAAQFRWMGVLEQRYWQMSVDDIIPQFPGSFTLPVAELRRISFSSYEDDESGQETHRMVIEANSGKYRFVLTGKSDDARKLLSQVLPEVTR
ncbi:MAG: zinc ribbon domain-containing protein [Chloroflexi bacterium]|nr:zinc ribbon domain-containing protein [Chloroflexota bacterium]